MKSVASFYRHLEDYSEFYLPLAKKVVSQLGGANEFKTYASDIVNYGIGGGFSGFIYYSDTVPFAKRNNNLIMSLANEQAEQFGYNNPITLIANFNCFKNLTEWDITAYFVMKEEENDITILNGLAWYAAEEICRLYIDFNEYE